jgi:UDP-glucose 4-epimerase
LILVTGGAGFIGSHTVEALLAAGERVRVLDDFSSGRRENLPSDTRLEVIEGDIRDAVVVTQAMQGVSKVLHLAAQVSVVRSMEEPVASGAVNLGGCIVVLDAARRAGVERFVYASSAAVYGAPDRVPVDESTPVRPQSPYGLEKAVADQYAALFRELYGLRSLGLRYFNVYGPRQDPASPYAGVISKFFDAARGGRALRAFGDGKQTRDFVFVRDVARVNVAALGATAEGVCNVGTGRSASLLELIEVLERVCGRELPVSHEPPRAGDIRHSATSVTKLRELVGEMRFAGLREGLEEMWG